MALASTAPETSTSPAGAALFAVLASADYAGKLLRLAAFIVNAVLAVGLYLLANPALLLRRFPAADERLLPMAKALIGGAIWSVAALFAVLRLLRLFLAGNRERLLGYARLLLKGLCLLFVAAVCLPLFQDLLAQLRAARRCFCC